MMPIELKALKESTVVYLSGDGSIKRVDKVQEVRPFAEARRAPYAFLHGGCNVRLKEIKLAGNFAVLKNVPIIIQ
jgi:hypothetical protein